MKAKVYIPIIIAAGAAAGLALGFANSGNGDKLKNEAEQTQAAQETTLSAEELAKIEEQKEEEYEEKVKEEEENAAEYFKKRQEEKKKKAEEEKKKAEEEKKKKEEEEKEKQKEEEAKESEDKQETAETEENDEPEYEYVYVPADSSYDQANYNSGSSNRQPAPQTTQHTHSWQAVYKTIYHNAKTHDEKVNVGTTEYTECAYNGETYFVLTTEYTNSGFYQVCKLADGSLAYETNKENEKKEITFFMDLMNISAEDEAYTFSTQVEEITDDITVTDQAAYDEQVFDHYICSGCGQTSY